jgi:hypothetical protein
LNIHRRFFCRAVVELKDAEVEWLVGVSHKLGQTLSRQGSFLAASWLFKSALDASLSFLQTTDRQVGKNPRPLNRSALPGGTLLSDKGIILIIIIIIYDETNQNEPKWNDMI